MKIKIVIPTMLRHECDGKSQLSIDVDTIADVLVWLKSDHPKLYRNVCHETDQLRPHVNLFVNSMLVCKHTGLATKFVDGDELYILPSVSGG